MATEFVQKGRAMRLLNVCPFKVGDVVYYIHDRHRHTTVLSIEDRIHHWILNWNDEREGEHYWTVRKKDPNHSGIRLLKRGDE